MKIKKVKEENIAVEQNRERQIEHFNKVGERIKELRISFGFTIKGFEAELCLPNGTIHGFESGKGGTSINLITIVNYFFNQGISLNWLLNYDNSNILKKEDVAIYFDIDKEVIEDHISDIGQSIEEIKKILRKYE